MVSVDVTETSKALAVAGGYVTLSGLVSYLVKEKLFMSEALLATLIGVAMGPHALNWFNPNGWSDDSDYQTHQITRVIIAIQVLFTGVALPAAYLRKEWLSLTTLLGPIMTTAWFLSSLLIWGLIPGLTFLESLVIGACVTPTDPVLANSICRGRFAEKHVPLHVRNIIVAESGANDGLGYPFLYLGLYLILIHEASHPWHTVGGAVLEWFYNIVLYEIVLSCIIGTVIGYVARVLLKFAKSRQLIDHESFLSFGVALTFVTLGLVGIIGSDDILACFVVGNALTWDDWFRLETEEHGFQDIIDQLLNSAIFLYIGAIMPWGEYTQYGLSPWRIVVLGICVMLLRRLPWVISLQRWIPSLCTFWEALFAGHFGPIGVGAVFYAQVALEVLPDDGTRSQIRNVLVPTVYFLVFTSVVVHGITVPMGKGFQRARTLTRTSTTGLTQTVSESEKTEKTYPEPGAGGRDTSVEGHGESSVGDPGSRSHSRRHSIQDDVAERGENSQAAVRFTSNHSLNGHSSRLSTLDRGEDLDRETSEDRRGGMTWQEGNDVVWESDDGERRGVVGHQENGQTR